jgi:choline kinase
VRALILAAGRGARLRPLTDDRPKCLVRLGGRTLLDWELAALRAAGIDDVAIVTGWRGARVRRRGLVRFRNRAWRRTDMVASLLCARRWLAEGPCLVAYGDSVHHPAVLRRLAAADHDVAIAYDTGWGALWRARFARPEEDAESLRVVRGRVRAIGGRLRHCEDADGQFMGLFRLTPRGLARIESALAALGTAARARLQTTQLLAALVAAGTSVGAIATSGRWCEVDGPDDVALYERRLRAGAGWRHDWRFRCG